MALKYKEGTRVGPKEILFIKRIPKEKRGTYGLFECYSCHQPFEARLDHITSGVTYNCPDCRSLKYKGNKNFNFKDLTGKRVGKLTVEKYLNTSSNRGRSMWRCRCECGNTIDLQSDYITQEVTKSCGYCSFKSNGEYQIAQVLKSLGIQYTPQYVFPECKDQRPLPFDFFLPTYNCCIEYDGTSHYVPNTYGSWNTPENVQRTQAHDKIKDEFCKKNNIRLIRIPYWELNQINEDYLKEKLK